MEQRRVVVAEDDADTRSFLREVLETAGWSVVEASDGESALRLAERVSPLAILMDIRMPGIDGIEACRRLQASPRTSGIPVILLSADRALVEEAMRSGAAFRAVSKPVRARDLLDAILSATSRGAERRREPRKTAGWSVELSRVDGLNVRGTVRDVSESGLALRMPEPLPSGDVVALSIEVRPDVVLKMRARVVHGGSGEAGVSFLALEPEDRLVLRHYVGSPFAR